ncbi:hypothetical protein LINGRAHAP2_LOCUS25988 [Linum grandiflorum]
MDFIRFWCPIRYSIRFFCMIFWGLQSLDVLRIIIKRFALVPIKKVSSSYIWRCHNVMDDSLKYWSDTQIEVG